MFWDTARFMTMPLGYRLLEANSLIYGEYDSDSASCKYEPPPSEATFDDFISVLLNPVARFVMKERFYYGSTYDEISKKLSLSRERIRQLENTILKHLKIYWYGGDYDSVVTSEKYKYL